MRSTIVAQAPAGAIAGRRRGRVLRFLGIPYAEPPLGALRFAAPRRRAPFEGIFPALSWGAAAPQRRSLPEPVARIARQSFLFSEDCLNLHVFTPSLEGRRPVLVFIHGGAFVIGSGAQYPGDDLVARGDCVVVTMNYRLGQFGFNAFDQHFPGDERFVANAGLLDQRLALEWVRDNIEAFGGDPNRVTIAGESAGAASVAFHLLHAPSRPLFHQAIMQSGGLNLFYPRLHAGTVAGRVLERLGALGDPDRLLMLDYADFAAAAAALAPDHSGLVSRPHIDGVTLPDRPLGELYALAKPVPLLIGTNRDEFSFFSDLPIFPIDGSYAALAAWVREAAGAEAAERLGTVYADERRGRLTLGTDILFRMPALHQAEAQGRSAPTFVYRLDWEAKGLLSKLGATHSVDLPLLFEDFLKPFRSAYLGLLPDPSRQALAARMRDRWVAFVRDGRPGDGWPAYDPAERLTMIFGARDKVVGDPEGPRRLAFDGIDAFTR
ncbi:carboxylesterase family protein [Aurantimonas sp. Leaf443]|uniref:carboxylesterase/lipase family protein n=1 Tax=Aurantimonas sp. Leaf443 TaxID=1736378 RepID=UPI0006F475C7|nr:carboxylesterase family protein [Aurantimonas sp. Leaf443]KQT86247.1 carboxylesterase [Aurantimonas sp. Leaf443]